MPLPASPRSSVSLLNIADRAAVIALLILAGSVHARTGHAVAAPDTSERVASTTGVEPGVKTQRIDVAEGASLRLRELDAPTDHEDRPGAPVLLLSGGPGFAGDQMMSTAKMVSGHRRALLLDQRGTGGPGASEVRIPAYMLSSIDAAVADLETVRDTMGLERWTMLGHSWGGLLSMAYAAKHPERVAELILLSPAGIDASFWATYQANLIGSLPPEAVQEMRVIRPAGQTMEAMSDYMRAMNRVMAPGMVANKDALEPLRTQIASDTMFTPAVGLMLQSDMMSYDYRAALATFKSPCVVIQGDSDAIGLDTTQKIIDTIPDAKRILIEDCGHFPYLERPDQLAAIIAQTLGTHHDDD